MSLKSIKLVTFDATNTVLKFRVPPWKYYAMVACDHGFQVTHNCLKGPLKDSFKIMWQQYPNFGRKAMSWEDWWRKVVNLTFKGYLPANTDTDPIADKLIDEYRTSKCWCVADGGNELLNLFKRQGIPIGVISNFDPRLKHILQEVGLHKYFDFILTSYDSGFSKPNPKIFETALSFVNDKVEPSEALHIGDDVKNDYEGARAAGWHALLVNPNIDTETPPAMKHVFNTLDELSSSIEQDSLIL